MRLARPDFRQLGIWISGTKSCLKSELVCIQISDISGFWTSGFQTLTVPTLRPIFVSQVCIFTLISLVVKISEEDKYLPRSISFTDLNDQETSDKAEDLWQQHLDELQRCRQEQV